MSMSTLPEDLRKNDFRFSKDSCEMQYILRYLADYFVTIRTETLKFATDLGKVQSLEDSYKKFSSRTRNIRFLNPEGEMVECLKATLKLMLEYRRSVQVEMTSPSGHFSEAYKIIERFKELLKGMVFFWLGFVGIYTFCRNW